MRKRRALKITGLILAFAMLFMATINLIPPKKNVADNPKLLRKVLEDYKK